MRQSILRHRPSTSYTSDIFIAFLHDFFCPSVFKKNYFNMETCLKVMSTTDQYKFTYEKEIIWFLKCTKKDVLSQATTKIPISLISVIVDAGI